MYTKKAANLSPFLFRFRISLIKSVKEALNQCIVKRANGCFYAKIVEKVLISKKQSFFLFSENDKIHSKETKAEEIFSPDEAENHQ